MAECVNFLVRTFCATYNQANYITEALQGFVMQKTTFPVVYTIVDDASTDRTAEVIYEFVKDSFDLQDSSVAYEKGMDYGRVTFARHKTNKNCFFAVIYLNENHYSQKKSKAPYLAEWMGAKYIALCEGDDYWTDPMKLQKQVDYLERNEDCCMCSHATVWKKNGEKCSWNGCRSEIERDLSTDEVIRNGGLYLATNSLVYRSWLNNDMPEWRKEAGIGDYPLQIIGTLRGRLHFLPDIMSVYRYQCEGSWTNHRLLDKKATVPYAKNMVLWFDLLDKDTNYNYTKAIHSYVFRYYSVLFRAREIGLNDYYHCMLKADDKKLKRFFKDILIRLLTTIRGSFK